MASSGATSSIADVLSLAITSTSVVVAIVAIIIAWGFSQRYHDHVRAIENLQKQADRYSKEIADNVRKNRQSIELMKLSMSHLHRLCDINHRISWLERRKNITETSSEWMGRKLNADDRYAYLSRMEEEIATRQQQRRLIDREVIFLIADVGNRPTNMYDLVENGDLNTLRLLESLESLDIDSWQGKELVRAIAQLQYRLKHSAPGGLVDSRSWTG